MRFRELLEKRWFAYSFAACLAVVLYVLLSRANLNAIAYFLKPVLTGFAIAYLVNLPANFFNRRLFSGIKRDKLRWALSVLLSFVLFFLVMAFLLAQLIPQLFDSIATFVGNLSGYSTSMEELLTELEGTAAQYGLDTATLTSYGQQLLQRAATVIPRIFNGIISQSYNFGRFAFNLFIAFILSIYLLGSKEYLLTGFKRLLFAVQTDKSGQKTLAFFKKMNDIMARYIVFSLLDAAIVGVANWIFMLICGMPYAIVVSLVVGVTNLAPTFGPMVGAIIGALILLFVNPLYALFFLAFTVVLQTLDGYVIKPKLFGNTLGVSGLWILIGIIVLGRMFGVIGILLAIPVVAIIDYVYHDFILNALESRHRKQQ